MPKKKKALPADEMLEQALAKTLAATTKFGRDHRGHVLSIHEKDDNETDWRCESCGVTLVTRLVRMGLVEKKGNK